jgi:hypothetical protein
VGSPAKRTAGVLPEERVPPNLEANLTVILFDPDGNQTFFAASNPKAYGYPESGFVARKYRPLKAIQEVCRTGEPVQLRHSLSCPSGTFVQHVRLNPLFTDEQVSTVVCEIRDIEYKDTRRVIEFRRQA